MPAVGKIDGMIFVIGGGQKKVQKEVLEQHNFWFQEKVMLSKTNCCNLYSERQIMYKSIRKVFHNIFEFTLFNSRKKLDTDSG